MKGMGEIGENEGGDKKKQYLHKLLIDEITAWMRAGKKD
jgi:hypothetical protein